MNHMHVTFPWLISALLLLPQQICGVRYPVWKWLSNEVKKHELTLFTETPIMCLYLVWSCFTPISAILFKSTTAVSLMCTFKINACIYWSFLSQRSHTGSTQRNRLSGMKWTTTTQRPAREGSPHTAAPASAQRRHTESSWIDKVILHRPERIGYHHL